jgi:4-amino-4-deoxy-L-arabinose transferase-like glycosyltransferase
LSFPKSPEAAVDATATPLEREPSARGPVLHPLAILVVVAAVIATRAPFRTHLAYDFDPANYCLAVADFDVHRQQPHPPGSPLFVMAARAVTAVLGRVDANLALEMVAWLASLGAVLATISAAAALRGSAWIAGLVLMFSPVFWAAGAMAEPYTCDALLFAIGALALARPADERWAGISLLSLAIGLGTGLRPSVALLLAPAWLWDVLRRRRLRARVLNVLVAAAGMAIWLVPLLIDAGGMGDFRKAHAPLRHLFAGHSLLFGADAGAHMAMVGRLAGWLAMLAVPALLFAAATRIWPRRAEAESPAWRTPLALLILPPLVFYAVVHFMKPFYALSFAAPLAVLAGVLATRVRPIPRHVLAVAIVAAQAGWFLLGDELVGSRHYGRVTAGALAAQDARTRANFQRTVAIRDVPFVFVERAGTWPGGPRILQLQLPEADFAYLPAREAPAVLGRRLHREEDSVFTATDRGAAVALPSVLVIDEAVDDFYVISAGGPVPTKLRDRLQVGNRD